MGLLRYAFLFVLILFVLNVSLRERDDNRKTKISILSSEIHTKFTQMLRLMFDSVLLEHTIVWYRNKTLIDGCKIPIIPADGLFSVTTKDDFEVCLAQSEQDGSSKALQFPNQYLNQEQRVTTCRQNLGLVSQSLWTELKRHGAFIGAVLDFAKRTMPHITYLYLKETSANLGQITRMLYQAVTGCFGKKYVQYIEPLLIMYKQYYSL